MIPKTIHYCWFGNKNKGMLFERCFSSWKKYCPNFTIIEWNESNFDIAINKYCKKAYEYEKYAFVSDVCRVFVLKKYGGIYFDTDVELIKDISDLLQNQAFMACEDARFIASGLGCGFERDHAFLSELLNYYNMATFVKEDGSLNLQSCPEITTTLLCDNTNVVFNEIKTIKGVTVYPPQYFSPSDFWLQIPMINNSTYAIHHFEASWIPPQLNEERALCQNSKSRVIFVSPHYDDAIGSCGGWINHLVNNGITPTVLTVFGKKYNEAAKSELIDAIHSKWSSDDTRAIENQLACDSLKCNHIDYDEFECIYRKDKEHFLYPNVGDEFDALHPVDLHLIHNLYLRLKHEYSWPRIFYFPAAIGHQVDHVIVNEVGKRLLKDGYPVVFYRDFTYEGEIAKDYAEKTYLLSYQDYLAKIKALNMYNSQVSMLFGSLVQFKEYMAITGKEEHFYYLYCNR